MLRVLVLVLLFCPLLAIAQDVPLGDVARATRQKAANASGKQEAKAKHVFTNDDVQAASSPAPAQGATSGATAVPVNQEPLRKFKAGLSTTEKLKMLDRIGSLRAVMNALERARRPLADKKDPTPDEASQIRKLDVQIGQFKTAIAKIEADLYE